MAEGISMRQEMLQRWWVVTLSMVLLNPLITALQASTLACFLPRASQITHLAWFWKMARHTKKKDWDVEMLYHFTSSLLGWRSLGLSTNIRSVKEQGSQDDDAVSAHASMDATSCELCGTEAALYCLADDAYLCRKCDKRVHGANFLASRHIRCLLCGTCQRLTHRYLVGSSVELMLPSILGRRAERFVSSSSDDYVTEPSTPLKMPFLFL